MSNTDLLKHTISNYRLLEERRIVFNFSVSYRTTPEQAEDIPGLVRGLIEALPPLRFDRAHFKGFGASSLDYEVVYVVQDPAYGVYMDRQQALNLGLMRALRALDVDFAFPTSTVQIARAPAAAPAAQASGVGGPTAAATAPAASAPPAPASPAADGGAAAVPTAQAVPAGAPSTSVANPTVPPPR